MESIGKRWIPHTKGQLTRTFAFPLLLALNQFAGALIYLNVLVTLFSDTTRALCHLTMYKTPFTLKKIIFTLILISLKFIPKYLNETHVSDVETCRAPCDSQLQRHEFVNTSLADGDL